MPMSAGLHRVSDAELLRLLKAINRDQLPSPISRKGLLLAQFAGIESELDVLVGQPKRAALTLLSTVLRDRRERRDRPNAAVHVLWDGPAPSGAGTCSAQQSLAELVATAEHSVVLTGADVERDAAVLRSLHAAQQGRGLDVLVILHAHERLAPPPPQAAQVDSRAALRAAPTDPRAALRAALGAVLGTSALRACIYLPDPQRICGPMPYSLLADRQRAVLVAGAAPSLEADERHLSAGVLLEQSEAVLALETQWRMLVHSAALLPLDPR